MNLVSWVLFYPEAVHPGLVFHILRHLIIIGLVFMAIHVDSCFFTIFLAILSILEYCRHCSIRSFVTLHGCLFFAFWLASYKSATLPGASPDFYLWALFRATCLFFPYIIDRMIVYKTGTKVIVDICFSVVLGCASEIMTMFDPLGIGANIASYCNDYPDFTFLPLRIGGPVALTIFIAFIAASASRWRTTRTLPRSVLVLLFKTIPTLIVVVYFARYVTTKSPKIENFGGVIVRAGVTCEAAVNEIVKATHSNKIIGVGGPLVGCTDSEFSLIKQASVANGAYVFVADSQYVYAIEPTGRVQTLSTREQVRGVYDMPLFVNSSIGRIEVLTGRQIVREDYFTRFDVDIIVSVTGNEFDEMRNIPMNNALVVSQSTGAIRFHVSSLSNSFLMKSDGHFAFIDQNQDADLRSFSHAVSISRNLFFGCYQRIIGVRMTALAIGSVMCIMVLLPKKNVDAIARFISRIVKLKSA